MADVQYVGSIFSADAKRSPPLDDTAGRNSSGSSTRDSKRKRSGDEGKKRDHKNDALAPIWIKSPAAGFEVRRPSKASLLGSCRSVQQFEKLNRIGEGTYGIVYQARDLSTRRIVALKRIKMKQETGGMPISSLREIRLLQQAKGHPNIVELVDVVVGRDLTSVFLTMEYCEQDLAALIDNLPVPLLENQVKCLMLQLVQGVEWLHSLNIIHRDLKMSNLLLTNAGIVKIADFGMARSCNHGLDMGTVLPLSPRVLTLWYRAPEVLFGDGNYGLAVDLWSLGCIFGELLLHEPLMPGKKEQQQIDLMCQLLGAPNNSIWPDFAKLLATSLYTVPEQPYNNLRERFPFQNEDCIDLLNQFFKFDPVLRISASSARSHPYWFINPLPARAEEIPTFSLSGK